jgi:ribonucleoside-diphosphate reductase alpha chain
LPLEGTRTQVLLQKDWIARAKSYARKFFKGNLQKTSYCLKDVHLFHKWTKVTRALKTEIDFATLDLKPEYTDVDTLGAVACAGGACELPAHMLPQQPVAA